MHIHSIKIYRSNRIKSRELLEFTVEKPITVIIGESGIGKSTLLEYSLPYPIDRREFYQDGYRELIFTYKDSLYRAISNSRGEHILIKDSEELTSGTTRKEFLQIVEKEFNLTNQIYKIVTGINRFTDISIGERKEWINLLVDNDLTFAYRFYKSIQDSIRDLKGVVKNYESKLIEIEDLHKIEKEVNNLEKELKVFTFIKERLLSFQYRVDRDPREEIETIMKSIKSLDKRIDYTTLSIDRAVIKSRLERSERIKAIILDRIESLEKSEVTNIDETLSRVDEIKEKIDRLTKDSDIPIEYIENLREYLESSDFISIIETLVDDFTIDREFEIRYPLLKRKIEEIKSKIESAKEHLEYLKEVKSRDSIECPKCHTQFKAGYSKDEEDRVKDKIETLSKELLELESKFKEYDNYNTLLMQHKEGLNRLLNFLNGNIYLATKKGLFSNLEDPDIKGKFTNFINSLIGYLEYAKELPKLNREYQTLLEKVKIIESLNRETLIKNSRELERLNRWYSIILQMQSEYKRKLKLYDEENRRYKTLNSYIERLRDILDNREEYRELTFEYLIRDVNKRIIDRVDKRVKELNYRLTSIKEKQNRSIVYRKGIEDSKREIEELKEIEKALSPKSGLIGEAIESQLGYIIDEVNFIIGEIFSYPIEIEFNPMNIDYKFQLVVKGSNPVSDISLASSGQKEVINLAFYIVTYNLLELEFPLLLDETGNRLDQYHRDMLFRYIHSLRDRVNNDIFIVSHYANNQIESDDICITKIE